MEQMKGQQKSGEQLSFSEQLTQHYAHVMNDSLAKEMDRIAPLVNCVPKRRDYYNYRRH